MRDLIVRDLRFAIRTLIRNPLFSGVAILTLALSIGGTTAIFSAVNAVLLNPLPYPDPDRLILLEGAYPTLSGTPSYDNLFEWRDRVQSLGSLAAFGGFQTAANLVDDSDTPLRVRATEVSAEFFDTMGLAPSKGRGLVGEDGTPGRNRVAVIGHDLWTARFGADPEIIGRSIRINGIGFEVVGVARPRFTFPEKTQIWIPLTDVSERVLSGGALMYRVIGRLAPGYSLAQAKAEIGVFNDWLAAEFAGSSVARRPIEALPLLEALSRPIGTTLWILFGAVAVLLLIACANVSNLVLSRSVSRENELMIRSALGAGGLRLASQLLMENLVLAFIGGAAGVVVASWAADLIIHFSPSGVPRLDELSLDPRVLAFAFAVTVAAGVLFGIPAILRGSRIDVGVNLRAGGSGLAHGGRPGKLRAFLVCSQIALALVLLVGAGLLIRSFQKVNRVEPGFSADNALTFSLDLARSSHPSAQSRALFFDQLIDRLSAIPGVREAAATNYLPLKPDAVAAFLFSVEGRPAEGVPMKDRVALNAVVTTEYFRAAGIPLLSGRGFTVDDLGPAPRVAMVNQALALKNWPDGDAVGKRIKTLIEDEPREIVGIVGNVRRFGLEEEVMQEIYLPSGQSVLPMSGVIVRSDLETGALIAAIREEVAALDASLPIFETATLSERLRQSLAGRRFVVILLGIFAGVALLLSAVGVYGVMSYSTSKRTREIGIRMALGADSRDVIRLVMRDGLVVSSIGIALGLAAAAGVTRVMTGLLYEVSPLDPLSFVAVSILLLVVSLSACWFPALRAARGNPINALRDE